jgi:glucokinase
MIAAHAPTDTRLLADIGGTNARFAWQDGPGAPLQDVLTLPCADFATIEAAMRAYLAQTARPGRGLPRRCAMGIANPIGGDLVQMTNHHWSFSIEALRRALALQELIVINDFTALALAIPHLQPDERRLMTVGPQQAAPGQAIGVLGAGTGLGMGGLVPLALPGGLQWAPIQGEGGHLSLAPETEQEMAVLRALQQRFSGRVSLERVLSGPGLINLLDALEVVMGKPAVLSERSAAAIVQTALSRQCPVCIQVLDTFCALLGGAAGDLALLLGARGGIYIGGGIVPRLGAWFDQSPFRARFEHKGRLSTLVREVPVFVIHAEVSPALQGVSQALR